ncbi:hypothetical protein QVD17_09901 [Tagetes erecta]|uniref:Uncharacterized protein n=1 Tax=Tagetes erecta TaxID=13708 RepID=A0AAD8L1E8_TARER|nr:hypothetical protein QVD17_09901 [Tagetes erecta]
MKGGGLWRDIYGVDEKKVASMVKEDKVDILVELTGHTANNKLGMMACHPAPLQVLLRLAPYDPSILCATTLRCKAIRCCPKTAPYSQFTSALCPFLY